MLMFHHQLIENKNMSELAPQDNFVRQQLQETHDSAKGEMEQTLIEAGKGHLIDVVAVTSRELTAASDSETSTAGYERPQLGDKDGDTIEQREDDSYAALRNPSDEKVDGVQRQLFFDEFKNGK